MSELTIEEAYAKMALRWNLPRKTDYMDLFLDVVPDSDHDLIIETFQFFTYQSDKKPYPGLFSSYFWGLKHKEMQEQKARREEEGFIPGCSRCSSGRVFYVYLYKNYHGDRIKRHDFGLCAACQKEKSNRRFYLQLENKIYLADRQIGKYEWVPDVDGRVLKFDMMPLHSNSLLEESFNLGRIPCPEEWIDRVKDLTIRKALMTMIQATNGELEKTLKDVPF